MNLGVLHKFLCIMIIFKNEVYLVSVEEYIFPNWLSYKPFFFFKAFENLYWVKFATQNLVLVCQSPLVQMSSHFYERLSLLGYQ